MRRFCLLLIVLMSSMVLTACSVQHQYAYMSPDSPADRACVARCSSGKSNCQKICQLKYENCARRRGFFCKKTCPCDLSFNTCYSACGGQVKTVL